MQTAELLVGAQVNWVADRLSPQDCKPRHLGRPVTFTYFLSDSEDEYESIEVIGILEGIAGRDVLVSGTEYMYEQMKNLKTWRVKIA